MSFVLLGILNSQASGVAQAYFLNMLYGSTTDFFRGVTNNSNDEIIAIGSTNSTGSGNFDFFIAKYDTEGNVLSQRVLGGTGSDRGVGVVVNSSNEVYISGQTSSDGEGGDEILLAKYDSNLSLQFQRVLGSSGVDRGRKIALDSGGNVYVCAQAANPSNNASGGFIAKYDSTGTIQFQKRLSFEDVTKNDQFQDIAIDSSDNIYLVGDAVPGGNTGVLLAKYDTSGNLQFQRGLSGSGVERGFGVACDSNGNVYVCGRTDTSEPSGDALIAKYNNLGTLQWQRTIGGSSADIALGMAIDSSNNVYIVGETRSEGEGDDEMLIAKFDSDGNIVFQRILGSTSKDGASAISIDSLSNIIIAGKREPDPSLDFAGFLAKLPNDGSLEGTYVLDGESLVYAASTLTVSTSSLTSSTLSLTASTTSSVSSTSTLTDQASTLTSETLDITA